MSDNPGLHFVDTNVLVYAHDRSAGKKHDLADRLIRDLWQSRSGCLSVQVLQEFYTIITRKVTKPLPSPEAVSIVAELSVWRVHSPEAADVLEAIALHQHFRISFWDAMVIRSATQSGCGVLFTENLNADQIFAGVRVVNPFHEEFEVVRGNGNPLRGLEM